MFRRFLSWLTRQRVPIGAMRIEAPGREAFLANGYALFYVGLAFLTANLIRHHPAPILGAASFTQDAWYVFFFKIGGLLLVPIAALRVAGYRPADFFAGWRLRPRSLAWMVFAFGLGFSLNLGHLAPIRTALAGLPPGRAVAVLVLAVLLPFFTAALPEELFFRGVLQTRLEATIGRAAGLFLATLWFVAWHLPTRYFLSNGVEGRHGDLGSVLLGTGVPVLLVGLVFAWRWDRARSLPALVMAHWGIDLLPALSSLLGIAR